MFSSGELVEATLRLMRRGRSIRPPRPPGEYPPGWEAWFREDATRARGSRLPVGELVSVMLAREPVHRTGYVRFGRLGAFLRLWRQDWREGPVADRGTRRLSLVASVLLHVLWLQLLVWLTLARFPGEADADRLGEDVIQVEYIGEGTPQEDGGGARQAEQPQPAVAASASPAPAPAQARQPVARAAPPPPPAQVEPQPVQEQPPPPVAEQPLVVSEPVQPEPEFELVVPRIDARPTPQLPTPEITLPTPEIQVVEVPVATPAPPVRPLPQREIAVPDLAQPEVELAERELPAPAPVVELRAPSSQPAAPELRRDGPAIAERAIDLRAPEPGEGAGEGSARQGEAAAGADAAADSGTAGGTRTAGQGASPAGTTAGAGLDSTPRPGALPSPRRGDDWGDSDRNVPGGRAGSPSGLFDADGRPRLAGNAGRAGGGLPPGTITEDYEKIDRMGTWLKRPPIGYEPTTFDRFWVPHETLLEEWVRRSIKEVLIPIPGTGKRIRCTVAMLMLGGACGISDPNMVDVDADSTAPPDVPFKRDLHEDPDSL
ncbi:hypothetical protein [Luteimonas sp. J29]|uniref:hypothetical protein n=1 Tax=Luteimonas sp. J29 TaxID=935863 RepID=UPI00047D4929|nr:hypothetical protein [Luteimonas sp. J29]